MGPRAANLVLIGYLVCAPAIARAGEIYRYVEPDGTIVYTNVKPKGRKAQRVTGSFRPAPRPSEVVPRAVRVTREEYDELIRNAARRYRIPEALVWAVMHAESNFNPHAVSRVGASGLMQLMPATAEDMYVRDIFDGDMVKMVAAYNAGPDAVQKYGGKVPPYAETQEYVRKVIALYFDYKQRNPRAA